MRWLLVKDLRILQRSPLLVGLLVIYPVVIAVLIGFALSRGPDKPEVAFYNGLSEGADGRAGRRGDRPAPRGQPPVRRDRPGARGQPRGGDPEGARRRRAGRADHPRRPRLEPAVDARARRRSRSSTTPRTRPRRQFVENTIEAQVQHANAALTKRIAEEALDLLDLIVRRRRSTASSGQDFDVLGLAARRAHPRPRRARTCRRARRSATSSTRCFAFASWRAENLAFSDEVLGVVGEPIRVEGHALEGGSTSLSAFAVALAAAVSLMFITLLLAAGLLALRARGERLRAARARARVAHRRCWRRRPALAAVCSTRRLPADAGRPGPVRRPRLGPAAALAAGAGGGALAFAALGLAIGALDARGAGRLAARLHALAAAGLPRARALGRGGAGAVRRDPGDLRRVPVQARARRPRRGAQRRRATWPARCCTWACSRWLSARSAASACAASPSCAARSSPCAADRRSH